MYPDIPAWVRQRLENRFGKDSWPTDWGRKQHGHPPYDLSTDDHWPHGYWKNRKIRKRES